jgi:hypothetical protein
MKWMTRMIKKMNENKQHFIFVDGWDFYCSNGNFTRVTKKELKESLDSGMVEDELKSMIYVYLTKPKVVHEYLDKAVKQSL